MDKKKVMVAIDESECSHYALQWALENLGDAISKSDLIIFTARPNEFIYVQASMFGTARKSPFSSFFVSYLVLNIGFVCLIRLTLLLPLGNFNL